MSENEPNFNSISLSNTVFFFFCLIILLQSLIKYSITVLNTRIYQFIKTHFSNERSPFDIVFLAAHIPKQITKNEGEKKTNKKKRGGGKLKEKSRGRQHPYA